MDKALSELLANCAEACGDRATVTLRLLKPEPRGLAPDMVRLCVMDSGPGFSAAMLKRGMEPFATSHAAPPVRGLGLAIVDASVRAVGGFVMLRNRDGGGATVELGLPVSLSDADRLAEAAD